MLQDRQAADILLLDVQEVTILADYFILCSGSSQRQIGALANTVSRDLKSEVGPPLSVEGEADAEWILIDYGDVIVHIFSPAVRTQYDLEGFWSEAQTIVHIQ